MPLVHCAREGRVALLTIDNPPVNAVNPLVAAEVIAACRAMDQDPDIDATVLMGAGRNFVAGADIRNFGKGIVRPGIGQRVADVIDLGDKPVVAAIHGYALGAGLEYALACHYRIATRDARLGLPEVLIGAIPGGGGTQRLPRLIGVAAALDLIVSGRHVPAPEALALGILDELVAPGQDLREAALAFAHRIAALRPLPCVRRRTISPLDPQARAALLRDKRAAMAGPARLQLTPWSCILAVEAACSLPSFDEGLREEQRLFDQAETTLEARALRYAFFAEREAARIPASPEAGAAPEIRLLAVLGAGTMGAGIAMAAADAGLPVLLHDVNAEALARGMGRIRANYEISAARGRLTAAEVEQRIALIRPAARFEDIADGDAVIEAVFENLELKRQIFARLDGVMKPDALLLTNTSALDIDRIAAATSRPQQVVGAHFFSPAQVMKLLEVIRCTETGDAALQATVRLGRRLRKTCVVVRNGEGFLTSRSRTPLTTEAMLLLEQGALPQQIDRVMTDFGYAMGPFAVSDLVGLDIAHALRVAHAAEDPAFRKLPVPDRLVEMGRLGQKTGKGWYRYAANDRRPQVDPEIDALVKRMASEIGGGGREFSDTEILHRLLFASVNECCRILEQGRIYRASDIDVAWLQGFGFPRFRGGPMFWADTVGLDKIAAQVQAWHAELGPRWAPAPLLLRAAASGLALRELKPMLQPLDLDSLAAGSA